jgi:hypothetical protein
VIAGATLQIADGVAIGAETLNLSGAGVGSNGALVVTSGAASFGGAITLGASAGIGGNGSLTLGGTVNDTSAGTSTLTQVGSGTLTFSNTVGATNALAAVTTSAGQTTAVNGGSVTTTGAQAYGGSVTTSGATALTSTGGGNITANNTANNFGGDLMLSTSGAASIVSSTALTLGASSVGTLTAQTLAGNLTQSGALTVGGTSSFATLASNASITLANTGNQLTGAVSLNTSGANGNASLTNASATVLGASTLGGNLTVQTDSISVSGPIDASGQTVTLAPLTASTAMTLGASGGLALTQTDLNNITASTLVLGSPGSTGGITVGGPVTLATTGLTNLSLITTSGITVSNPITVTNGANATLTLNTTGTATQSAAITASNLALLGSGGSYTLNHSGNLIGTVAANTGSVNLTSNGAVTIGAVGGVTGWTTTGNSRLTASGGTSDITVSNAVNWSNSSLTLVAGRNITINANMTGGPAGDLTALANGNLTIGAAGLISGKTIALSATGAFTNNRGSDAVSASDRWLVYSSAPDAPGQNFGNLNSNNTAIWNSTYATLPPPLVTYPGNRYIFAFAAGTTPATLTVTSLNDSKTYGDTASLSLFTVSGFQAGVANAYLADPNVYSGTPGLFSAGATAIANAGIYPIIASQGTLAASGNYSFAFNNTGLLTVNPKALTITANDATQTYDGVAFSGGNGVTYNGFVNGQNASVLSGTIAYVGNSQGAANAGTYTIIPSNQTSSNYAINYVNATLTINPQPLTITANNVTQTFNTVPYSGANGVIYSGFVNGQNSSVLSGSIIYGGNSQGAVNVGSYTIIPSGQTSSNYAITYVNGTLTITPPPMAFVLDALGTAANAAGTTSPSTVMNATVLPSPTSLPGNITFGSNTVFPYGYGNDAGVVGGSASQQTSNTSAGGTSQQASGANTNQQTSSTANTSQQTSKKRNGNTNQQTSNKRNGRTNQQTNKRNGSTNQQTSNTSDRRTN